MKAELIELWIAGKIDDMQLQIADICPIRILDNGAQAFKMPKAGESALLNKLRVQIEILKELQKFCETLEDDPVDTKLSAIEDHSIDFRHDDPRYQDSLWEK